MTASNEIPKILISEVCQMKALATSSYNEAYSQQASEDSTTLDHVQATKHEHTSRQNL